MSQSSSSHREGEEILLNFSWPGPFPIFQTSIYRDSASVESQGRRLCRVFLGPNLSPTQYSSLKNFFEDFDNAKCSGLVLTTYSGTLSNGQQQELLRLIRGQVAGHVETRTVEPTIGYERVVKRIVYPEGFRISSSFSIPVDCLNGLAGNVVQRLCVTLDNLELVHLLPPKQSLLRAGGIDPCRNALEILWQYTPNLRKCVLPLDLFEYIAQAFEVLQFSTSLEEVELTFPVNDEVLRFLHPQGSSYEPTMTYLSPRLAQLTRLRSVTIPITFVSPGFLFHIATLPWLVTLTVIPVGVVHPLRHILGALGEAQIHQKGTNCFENLTFLDLGPCDPLQRHLLDAPEISVYCQALRTIFVDTWFCGDWLESELFMSRT